MNSDYFEYLTNLLTKGIVSLSNNEIKLQFTTPFEKDQIQKVMQNVGYDFDEYKTFKNNILTISLKAQYWDDGCPIFETWDEVFELAKKSSLLPKKHFVIEELPSNRELSDQIKRIELFCLVRKLLAELSDLCEPEEGLTKGSKRVVLLIENDSNVYRHEFQPTIDWQFVNSMTNIDSLTTDIHELHKAITVGDSQDSERKFVMKSALHELISLCHGADAIFPTVLKSVSKLLVKYKEHHELFIKKFSVNKILHEINEQDLNYTSKINEIISGAQSKALAIPGALIAIGAIMKIDHVIDGIAIAIGMIITTIIVHKALNVHSATLKHIKKQVGVGFSRYDILSENTEVRLQAKISSKELNRMLCKAIDNTGFMRTSIWIIFAVTFVFIVWSSLHLGTVANIG